MEELPKTEQKETSIGSPVVCCYPPGNPNDLTIVYFKYPTVKNIKGKQVDDKRSSSLLDVVHEPIGHLLSRRRIALYLELYYPEINVTMNLIDRCYHVFKLICQKSTLTDYNNINEGSLDFSFESYCVNPGTFNDSRTKVVKNLFSTANPTFALCDIGYRINTHLEKDEKGKYIRHDCDLLKILLYEGTYLYFVKMWTTFPDLQCLYNALRVVGFPPDICNTILRYSTFGKKDHSGQPEVDPFAIPFHERLLLDMEREEAAALGMV